MIGSFFAVLIAVTDGDTFKARVQVWDGVEVVTAVRILGIDTPEIKGKCASERAAALAAKDRLARLLASGTIVLNGVTPDKFAGRVDASVTVGNVDVGSTMINEGFARPYLGGTRAGWCP